MFCYEPSWPKFPFIPGGSSRILFEHAGPYIHRSCAAAVLAAACLVWQSIGLVQDFFQFKFRMCNFLKPCLGLKLSSLQRYSCDHPNESGRFSSRLHLPVSVFLITSCTTGINSKQTCQPGHR